jgi:Flp pilus assembly protein CpaB
MRFPSFRRKLPLSSKILFGLAGSLAVFAFLLVQSETRRAERAQAATGPLATVVVAARDLSAGAAIGPDDVRLEQMPEVFLPPAAVPAAEAAVGLITAGPVGAGEVLVSTRLGASAFGLSVDPGHVAVTIGFASVPDGLTVADRVDAFATFGGARPYTSQVGEDLRILSLAPAEESFDGPGATKVTLDVDPETARLLLQAEATGTLGLAARAATPTLSPGPTSTPSPAMMPG